MTDWVGAALGMDEAPRAKVTPAAVDWVGVVTGTEKAPEPAKAASGGTPEPDAKSWLGRRVQDIRGKRDPRMANAPTIAEVLLKDGGHSVGSEAWAWLTGASDEDMASVYRGMLGDRFIREEKDANDYPVVVYKGKDGKEARAYVNKPGIDMQDTVRGVYGALPFVATGGMAGSALKGAGVVGRMAGQAATMGATSVAQDAAGVATGVSDLDLEKTAAKAGVAAIGGAGGEALAAGGAALWRKLITEPRYFDKMTGQLTKEGEAALKAAGLDPADIPADLAGTVAKELTKFGDDVDRDALMRSVASSRFGIPRTKGEMTGNQQQLLREQQMFGGTYGEEARHGMAAFRDRQQKAIQGTVLNDIPEQIAPGSTSITPAHAGANIRANTMAAYDAAKQGERAAWQKVPRMVAKPEELELLPQVLAKRADDLLVDEHATPAAAQMGKMLDSFMTGKSLPKAAEIFPDTPVGDINQMRKALGKLQATAKEPEDRRAAKIIYDSFNDWIGEAAKMRGDPEIAAAMVTARGISRKVHAAFEGPPRTGADLILKKVLETTDNAEGIVNALFSAPSKSQIKAGAVSALNSLKKAYDDYLPPEAAKAAWDDIRLAYWQRLTRKPSGEVMGPAELATALKTAAHSQNSIMRMLYSDQERGMFKMLAFTLDDVKRRNPNTSWSAIGVGQLAKDVGDAILTLIGGNSIVGRSAARWAAKPFAAEYGSAQLQSAIGRTGQGATLPALPPPAVAPIGGALGAESQR